MYRESKTFHAFFLQHFWTFKNKILAFMAVMNLSLYIFIRKEISMAFRFLLLFHFTYIGLSLLSFWLNIYPCRQAFRNLLYRKVICTMAAYHIFVLVLFVWPIYPCCCIYLWYCGGASTSYNLFFALLAILLAQLLVQYNKGLLLVDWISFLRLYLKFFLARCLTLYGAMLYFCNKIFNSHFLSLVTL